MTDVIIEITRFVDECPPGMVECVLVDAFDGMHRFVDKVPIVSTEDLWSDSAYPRPGVIRCEVEKAWTDDTGRSLLQINTERPDFVESSDGGTRFVVLATQVVAQ